MKAEVLENHKRYLDRINFQKNFGYDVERERKFILEKSQPIKGDILEVGTGKGYFTVELAKAGYDFISVDLSAEEQEFARLNLEYSGLERRVNFKIDDAENLSFEDGAFDVVFAVNALHHFEKPFRAMDELARVAKPGGKIIFSDFSKEGFEIIDKIHTNEGREHKKGSAKISQLSVYLRDKDFIVKEYKSKFEDVVVAHRLII